MNSIIFEEQNEFSESKDIKSIELRSSNRRQNQLAYTSGSREEEAPLTKKIDFDYSESTPININTHMIHDLGLSSTPHNMHIEMMNTNERRLTGGGKDYQEND